MQHDFDDNNDEQRQMKSRADAGKETPQPFRISTKFDRTLVASKQRRSNANTASIGVEELAELRAQKLKQDITLGNRLLYKTELEIRVLENQLGKPKSSRFEDSFSDDETQRLITVCDSHVLS
jgi:hypothetical protein